MLDTRPGVDPAIRFKAPGGVGINPPIRPGQRTLGRPGALGLARRAQLEEVAAGPSLRHVAAQCLRFHQPPLLVRIGTAVRLLLPLHAPGRAHLRPDHVQGPPRLDRAGPPALSTATPGRWITSTRMPRHPTSGLLTSIWGFPSGFSPCGRSTTTLPGPAFRRPSS